MPEKSIENEHRNRKLSGIFGDNIRINCQIIIVIRYDQKCEHNTHKSSQR